MTKPEPPVCPPPLNNHLKPSFTLPPGATDCHAHVFGDRATYGYADNRLYTPPPGVVLKDYLAMLDAIGFTRGVMVHTGVHGTDNSVIVDAMAQTGGRLRAVALLREDVNDKELEALDKAGVRGFRANLVAKIGVQFDAAKKLAARVAPLGWHAQFLMDVETFPELDRIADAYPCEMVIDHMGRPEVAKGVNAPGVSGAAARAEKRSRVVEVVCAVSHVARTDTLRRPHALCARAGRCRAGSIAVRHRLAARDDGRRNAEYRHAGGAAGHVGAGRRVTAENSGG